MNFIVTQPRITKTTNWINSVAFRFMEATAS